MNQYICRVCKGNECTVLTSQGPPNCGCLHNSDIGAFTNKKYVFGSDWLADWFIEKIGYLRTPEGKESLEQFKKENRK